MPTSKIAVTVDREVLAEVDRLVRDRRYPSRSRAVQVALEGELRRQRRRSLVEEASKLDPAAEQAMADDDLDGDAWPAY